MLDKAADFAFEELEKAGGNPELLSIPLQTLVVIYSAQGIIDNGGLEYFFESDFPGKPPYTYFSQAYHRIGALSVAECLERAAAMFPFQDPHLSVEARREFLEQLSGEQLQVFSGLGSRACGDKSVWERLEEYVISHNSEFANA